MYNTSKFSSSLLQWYDINRRDLPWRECKGFYPIYLSEVMLQQTKVETVIPYYKKWLNKYPTLETVALSNIDDLLKLWEGLGYYSRCRNFYKASQIVEEKYNGNIPDSYSLFRKLPGVGDYIAAAVMSIAFNKNYPAVDGNLKRVISRYLGIKKLSKRNLVRIDNQLKKMIMNGRPGDINQSLMDIGSLICKPKEALCTKCPLIDNCKCIACKNFPIAYIHHLFKINDPLGLRLATIHNLVFIQELMNKIRKSIHEENFLEFKKEFLKNYTPPNEEARLSFIQKKKLL